MQADLRAGNPQVKGRTVSKGPARGYSRPPFEKDNKMALKHGAYSPALVTERADELVPEILGVNPQLDAGRDGAALLRYAVNLARIERVYSWLAEQDDAVFEDATAGKAHGIYDWLGRWERAASDSEDRLAIAPLTRAKLGIDQLRAAATVEEIEESRKAKALLDARAKEIEGK